MTMHHIPDVAALVRTFHGMLKPGGWLALADLDAEDGSFHGGDAVGVMHQGFDRAALQADLRAAGFSETHARTAHTVAKTAADGPDKPLPGIPDHRACVTPARGWLGTPWIRSVNSVNTGPSTALSYAQDERCR